MRTNNMNNQSFYAYAEKFGTYDKRSMFGGTGLFSDDAMYALIREGRIYLRGGDELDEELNKLRCSKFRHIKKHHVVTVNYYDVTDLLLSSSPVLDELVTCSIRISLRHKAMRDSKELRRIRDLPNMRLTLERMVVKSGIRDIKDFMELGAAGVFQRVQIRYGKEVDISLLWKFAGAIEGVHWELLGEATKKALKHACGIR